MIVARNLKYLRSDEKKFGIFVRNTSLLEFRGAALTSHLYILSLSGFKMKYNEP